MKAAVAAFWRYTCQHPLIAFEASCGLHSYNHGGQADVLAVTQDRRLLEAEVKTSMTDFRRDKRKTKHRSFLENDARWPTHHFYFAVPKGIAKDIAYLCDQLYPYAGVFGIEGEGIYAYHVFSYRSPKPLNGERLSLLRLTRMAREQSATLCRLQQKLAEREKRIAIKTDSNING